MLGRSEPLTPDPGETDPHAVPPVVARATLDRLRLTRRHMLDELGFWRIADLALRLRFEERFVTRAVSTAVIRADGTFYCNPEWIAALTIPRRAVVLAHEILHLALGHFERRAGRDPILWNFATDLVVNAILDDGGLTEGPGDDLFPWDPRYAGMSAGGIYDELEAQVEQGTIVHPLAAALASDDPSSAAGGGFGSGLGDCDFVADVLVDSQLSGPEWGWALFGGAPGALKFRGDVPAWLERAVEQLRPPELPWQHLLQRAVRRHTAGRLSFEMPSPLSPSVSRMLRRRYGIRTMVPGRHDGVGGVVVAVDTSGSMSTEELTFAVSETRAVLRLAGVSQPVRFIACDADVHVDTEIRHVGQIELTGGGGTCTEPVFERLGEPSSWGEPALVIYFSDLYASYPTRPPRYPVIWVATEEGGEAPPFGQVVRRRG